MQKIEQAKENLNDFEVRRAEYEKNQTDVLANAQVRQSKIEGQVYVVTAKAGVDGKLFGSVTSFDIVEAVNKSSGIEIIKSEVTLPNGPLKTVGEFDVTVILHHDVHATIKVNVTPEA